jgi:hypothetical protein
MAGRDSANGNGNTQPRHAKVRRRRVVIVGGAVGAFVAAAAMATGSAVTAAPAKADFEDLLDPIIQPILTQVTDSVATFDPTLATDLTSWTDTFLADLNSLDSAAAAASTAGSAAAAPASDPTEADPTTGTYDIPITVNEGTEPTVQASIDGSSDQTLLVDTGSSGLVIPWQDLDSSNPFQALVDLYELGTPTGISESGYSGGVDYVYLTYDDATVNYGDGALTTTSTPIDVEFLSWPTSFSPGSPLDFQQFLTDDGSTGILGIGGSSDGGPTESPLEYDGYNGVTVDVPQGDLIVDPSNPGSAIATLPGAPIPTSNLSESVDGGTPVAVSDDIDSGGVYGTIPSSLIPASDDGVLPDGSTVTVSDGSTVLYSYTVENDGVNNGLNESPSETTGDSIDSGYAPFNEEPIYINYTDNTLTFDKP